MGKMSSKESVKYKWVWCEFCNCAAVICPNCGNNCCNGGSREGCIDECSNAYVHQENMMRLDTYPKTPNDCDCVLPNMMEKLFGKNTQ